MKTRNETTNPQGTENGSTVKALKKVMMILDCFSRRSSALTPTEIAEKTGMPRTTTHRLISSMREIGLLDQDGKRDTYRLGMRLFQLGSSVIRNIDLDKHARPYVAELQLLTGEAVHLCIFNGSEMVFLDRQEMIAPSTTITRIESAPIHCTGVGKAFLAFQPQVVIEKLIADGLDRQTENTIIDPAKLMEDLKKTRERGYSIDLEENQADVRCVGAPIRDSGGSVFAAISVSSQVARMPMERLDRLGMTVQRVAQNISVQLGWKPTGETLAAGEEKDAIRLREISGYV